MGFAPKFAWLPDATRDAHGRDLSWSTDTNPKGCLHTTESPGWPEYRGWTVHPHGTVRPIPRVGVEVRQHVPFTRASFALRNEDGGVQTNRDLVAQWELVGTCERGGAAHRAGAYLWPDADDAVLADLHRKVIAPTSEAMGIPLVAPAWQAYPASYGARGRTNTVRMTGPAFDGYSGWLGHQHVPENVHGDPGAFPWARMLEVGAMAKLDAEDRAWLRKELERQLTDLIPRIYVGEQADVIPLLRPPNPANPSWQPASVHARALDDIWKALEALAVLVQAAGSAQARDAELAARLAAVSDQVAAVAAQVAALDPAAIAAAVEEAVATVRGELESLTLRVVTGESAS